MDFFWHCATFFERKKFKFFFQKNVLRFLSLRYSADFRRSRLVFPVSRMPCWSLVGTERLMQFSQSQAHSFEVFRACFMYTVFDFFTESLKIVHHVLCVSLLTSEVSNVLARYDSKSFFTISSDCLVQLNVLLGFKTDFSERKNFIAFDHNLFI